jgi:hypothetical protein
MSLNAIKKALEEDGDNTFSYTPSAVEKRPVTRGGLLQPRGERLHIVFCDSAARLLGCLVAWLLGCLVAWLLGCLVAWLLGCLVAWLLDRRQYAAPFTCSCALTVPTLHPSRAHVPSQCPLCPWLLPHPLDCPLSPCWHLPGPSPPTQLTRTCRPDVATAGAPSSHTPCLHDSDRQQATCPRTHTPSRELVCLFHNFAACPYRPASPAEVQALRGGALRPSLVLPHPPALLLLHPGLGLPTPSPRP